MSKWERFVTTTLDFKNKWVDGAAVPDPSYTPCTADPDDETSAPPVGSEGANPFSKSNYTPTTTRDELQERRSIARKLSSVSSRPAAPAAASVAAPAVVSNGTSGGIIRAQRTESG